MKISILTTFLSIIFAATFILTSCGGESTDNQNTNTTVSDVVTSHELSDPQMLNPLIYTDAAAGYITNNIFYALLEIDFNTLELVPVVAESLPEIEVTEDGKMKITYNIRKEARFDDGTPITAKDVEFALKVILNPKVDNPNHKPSYEFIKDMILYDDNPLKFTFISDDVFILAEVQSGDIDLIPRNIYDPKGLLDEFTIKELVTNAEELAKNEKIIEFATTFNSEKHQRDKEWIQGCGPYVLDEWQTGQKIVLKKKENWWGDQLKDKGMYFNNHPSKIVYQTINDETTAKEALKAGEIDVMRSIKPKDFNELNKTEKYTNNFNSHTPTQLAYTYLGINTRKPMFADKRTRQALAHLIDVDKIIDVVVLGYGTRAVGPVHPSKAKQFNNDIKPYDYNPEKAKELLKSVGWEDRDGDGVLDNTINGEKMKFEMEYLYNQGNDSRKAVGLLFQEEARKIGITVNVVAQDWSIFLEHTKQHDFDMYYGAWVTTPIPIDHKQIYHTVSYNGGSNYVGFGDDKTDALIDSIRVEIDEDKRAILNKEFQKILHDECSYIFLYNPTERIAIHKRFSNAATSPMRPGYRLTGFTINQPTQAD
jgi:peptide/nickel transport system substrate-binding protein